MPDGYMPRFLSREGRVLPGVKRVITVPQPAAGAGWAVTVPGGRQWRVQGGAALLTTDATAANRLPVVQLSDQTSVWWDVAPDASVPASTAQRFSLGAGVAQGGANVAGFPIVLPLPDMFLPAGTRLAVTTTAEDVNDQWSAVALMVEESYLDDQELTILHLEVEAAERAALRAATGQKAA